MLERIGDVLRRVFTTIYAPDPGSRDFLSRAQTQTSESAEITVAVLSAKEGQRLCGVSIARHGIQAVYLKIVNRHSSSLRLYMSGIDPHYFTPREAAGINHFSVLKRLSTFGLLGLYFFPVLLLVAPFKIVTAYFANRRMDECFRALGLHPRPIPAGAVREGFVFTPLDSGVKVVTVSLYGASGVVRDGRLPGPAAPSAIQRAAPSVERPLDRLPDLADTEPSHVVEFTFSLSVPGLTADYQRRDFDALCPPGGQIDCNLPELLLRLAALPRATTNSKATREGDPVNLVVIGPFETLLGAFAARWDESETITLATCWKTAKAFMRGTEYRYSPVSPLYLFSRSQDVALQRIRQSINERLHLRLWISPLRFEGQPVWVGQISRDIGVRFTVKTWNLTTHRVDPDVDESRDYVVEDLLRAERVDATGYVGGVGACAPDGPRHNLTGDPYFTDGKRAVVQIAPARTRPRLIAWQ